MEIVISSFNTAMEQSELRVEKLKQTVMKEAIMLIAKCEEAETRRLDGLGVKMNKIQGVLFQIRTNRLIF